MADEQSSLNQGEAGVLKGITKAAVLLLSLDGDISAAVLRQLDQGTVEEITRAIAHLDTVGLGDRGQVIELTPPVSLSDEQAEHACGVLCRLVRETVTAMP